jgi:hypothetical protein
MNTLQIRRLSGKKPPVGFFKPYRGKRYPSYTLHSYAQETFMSTLTTSPNVKLRDNPQIAELFRVAESRHLTETEFAQYLTLVPEFADRVEAAQEIMAAELTVVTNTVKQVFFLYPFSKYHELPKDKCIRDVSYVSAYATHSMLMDEPDWFRDKLLIWLKTILKAFCYPAREERKLDTPSNILNTDVWRDPKRLPHSEITEHADTLPQNQRAIYETYARLIVNYQQVLSPKAFALIQPHLQLAVDILASD